MKNLALACLLVTALTTGPAAGQDPAPRQLTAEESAYLQEMYPPPKPPTPQEIAATAAHRAEVRKVLDRTARQAVALLEDAPGPRSADARSWFGGLPRMPAGLDWPRQRSTRKPMTFLAQVDLAEVPDAARPPGMPKTGTLWFFAALDYLMEEREQVAVLYRPARREPWPERAPPKDLGPVREDAWPYDAFPKGDPRASIILKTPMRLVAHKCYDAAADRNTFYPDQPQELIKIFREEDLKAALGGQPRIGPSVYMSPEHGGIDWRTITKTWPPTGSDAWPQAGVFAETAALSIPAELHTPAQDGPEWAPEGRALREQLEREARAQAATWSLRRFTPLSAGERKAFRTWADSVTARVEAMPREKTGGYRLAFYPEFLGKDEWHSRYSAYQVLEHGAPLEVLPEAMRQSWDWMDQPNLDQMFGYGAPVHEAAEQYRDHVLLMQLADTPSRTWTGGAVLSFWISQEDLARGRFDRAFPTLEAN
ncbi:DUF1963 domain-containing protein [Caulobacter endophyticus]|uniref:DUF1963 domain-containing protein n=1 Tax=Caulobacter endophyticus TaxID=2172652 RepID=UPI00240F9983|nr:DUF1963 domain-containing protein [Caulobacter endophyticus]MDG2528480.1 DUF1963 domain-containing protein [Caulobacter endophyticus]